MREWSLIHTHRADVCDKLILIIPLESIALGFLTLYHIFFVLKKYVIKIFTALKELDEY